MHIITKSIADTLTIDTVPAMIEDYDCESYYVWCCVADDAFFDTQFTHSNVVLALKDLPYDIGDGENLSPRIIRLLEKNKSANIIVITSMENIQERFARFKNVKVVRMGGDWLNQIQFYEKSVPIREKDFSNSSPIVSFNRSERAHRTVLLSYVYGLGLGGKFTYLTDDIKQYDNFLDLVPLDLALISDDQRTNIIEGYLKLRKVPQIEQHDIYVASCIENFDNNIRHRVNDTFLEIVNETTYSSESFLLTEKTMHSFLSFHFPIIISNPGVVKFLRSMGFDMFDDIIDHSYDDVQDVAQRIVCAVDSNIALLTNAEDLKQKWKECLPRFERNWHFISSGNFAKWYTERMRQEFLEAVRVDTK